MKTVLYVAGGIAMLMLFAAAVVLVVGALLPKHHIATRSVAFRATPDQLFTLIAGPQDWRPDVARTEIVSDAAGRNLLRETTRDGQTITYEVVHRVPPTSLKRRIVTENLPYSGTWTFTLQPQGDLTVVRITEDGQVYNPIFRFVSRFILGHTRTLDAYLNDLAKATEQTISTKD